ncbi:MAG: F0F1 ATP synthase subunit B [Bacteroidales bacterium]|nr:F0F1 ATP synthase subunit B [Bacteroidales bacterium]
MGLLTPEVGLLFWMTVAFAVVFAVLAKVAFPIILGAMNERKAYIDSSLDEARKANSSLEGLKAQGMEIVSNAEHERVAILKDAAEQRDRIIGQAETDAQNRGAEIIDAARRQAEVEREAILAEARNEVALLALGIAEKVMRRELDSQSSRDALSEAMFDELK